MSTTRIRIGPSDHGRPMTLEEFREAEEQEGYRYELARGVLEVTEVPSDDHGQVVDNLHESFSTYRRQHPGVIRRIGHGSDTRLLIPEWDSDRNPDLAIIFPEAPKNQRGRQIPGLVVEVLSPGRRARDRDYLEKREEYLTRGVREYWIVDRFQRLLTVLIRREAEAGPTWEEHVYREDQRIHSEALPRFDGRVADLWVGLETDDANDRD